MNIVGFSTGAHDVSYAIVQDGVPIYHYELERYNRLKECHGDIINDYLKSGNKADIAGSFNMHWMGGVKSMYPNSCQQLEKNTPLRFFGHHKLHAANAFFSSNFQESLIVTADGGGTEENGEDVAYTEYLGKGTKIHLIRQIPMSKINIGYCWSIVSNSILGLGVGNQSGTLMAMAAFGKKHESLVSYFKSCIFNSRLLNKYDFEKYQKNDVAASLQEATEEVLFNLVENLISSYPNIKNICFSGGVCLNSSALGKLKLKYISHNFYVPPVPYDAGLSIGFAQYVYHHELGNNRIKWEGYGCTPYLGGKYDISDDIKKLGRYCGDDDVISLLLDNKIVSVYGGRSESGRRALGNRSILANPLNLKMKDMINDKVKHRQSFRPFAPSVIREDVSSYFTLDLDCPYMFLCIPFLSSVVDKIPSVVHKDGTGRLQTVTEKDNSWYYNFLLNWKKKSGHSILLNTSFNDREPIVETPEDALRCFNKTNIDYLYFRDCNILVSKKND